jgi:predicted dehydrogenase
MAKTAKKVHGDKVRYAVVGAGWISQTALLPGVEHTGNSVVTTIVTGHEYKTEKLAEKYPSIEHGYSYEEYDDFLKADVADAVYLATPNFDHVELAVKTLEAGLHLLLEKPMAVSVGECQRIIAASQQTGAKLMLAYRLHFEPGTLKALERVRNGELGTIRYFNSSFSQPINQENHRAKNGYWAGPVPDMGPYPINMVRLLFGSEPLEVFATGVKTEEKFNFDDTVAMTLKFASNRVAAFVLSYNGQDLDDFRIVGELGSIYSDPAYAMPGGMTHIVTIGEKTSEESFRKTDQFGGELKYFSDCVINGTDPEPDGEEGLLDVRVLVAAEQSLKTGMPVKLQPYVRTRRAASDQVQHLSPVKTPELIGAHKPSEGQ